MNDRTYPIIEDAEEQYNKAVDESFVYYPIPENRLVPMGVGNMVPWQELVLLRNTVIEFAKDFGFPSTKPANNEVAVLDKQIGRIIYETMDITPSVAATIPMWHFINLCLLPDYVFWRFGASKDHFISDRRNYFGTQWWRYYIFCILYPGEDTYFGMSDRMVADLYERSNTCGYPKHVVEQYEMFRSLCKEYYTEISEIRNSSDLFRECLKLYGARLSYRSFFSLTDDVKNDLFRDCFLESIPVVIKCQKNTKIKIRLKK